MSKMPIYQERQFGFKRLWTTEEDQFLKQAVNENPKEKWININRYFNQLCIRHHTKFIRNTKQCRQRWLNNLNPNLNNDFPWTMEQDLELFNLYEKYGSKWSKIITCFVQKGFTLRGDNNVKNHFFASITRGIKILNQIIWKRKNKIKNLIRNIKNKNNNNNMKQNQQELLIEENNIYNKIINNQNQNKRNNNQKKQNNIQNQQQNNKIQQYDQKQINKSIEIQNKQINYQYKILQNNQIQQQQQLKLYNQKQLKKQLSLLKEINFNMVSNLLNLKEIKFYNQQYEMQILQIRRNFMDFLKNPSNYVEKNLMLLTKKVFNFYKIYRNKSAHKDKNLNPLSQKSSWINKSRIDDSFNVKIKNHQRQNISRRHSCRIKETKKLSNISKLKQEENKVKASKKKVNKFKKVEKPVQQIDKTEKVNLENLSNNLFQKEKSVKYQNPFNSWKQQAVKIASSNLFIQHVKNYDKLENDIPQNNEDLSNSFPFKNFDYNNNNFSLPFIQSIPQISHNYGLRIPHQIYNQVDSNDENLYLSGMYPTPSFCFSSQHLSQSQPIRSKTNLYNSNNEVKIQDHEDDIVKNNQKNLQQADFTKGNVVKFNQIPLINDQQSNHNNYIIPNANHLSIYQSFPSNNMLKQQQGPIRIRAFDEKSNSLHNSLHLPMVENDFLQCRSYDYTRMMISDPCLFNNVQPIKDPFCNISEGLFQSANYSCKSGEHMIPHRHQQQQIRPQNYHQIQIPKKVNHFEHHNFFVEQNLSMNSNGLSPANPFNNYEQSNQLNNTSAYPSAFGTINPLQVQNFIKKSNIKRQQ